MPQPTTNSWPFEMKEFPSADGHVGGEVAGAGAAEDETVAGKLEDAGMLGAEAPEMAAEPLDERPLDGLDVPGTVAPNDTEAADAGVGNELPLELLVPEDET